MGKGKKGRGQACGRPKLGEPVNWAKAQRQRRDEFIEKEMNLSEG